MQPHSNSNPELIKKYDDIKDTSGKKYLLDTLKFPGMQFKTSGKRQNLEEYNKELEENDAEIENGKYISMDDLLKEIEQW